MSSLNGITVGTTLRPPRLVLYGVHGIGKTTFATSAPNPIVLRTEDGLGTIRAATFPDVATYYEQVLGLLRDLYTETHNYQTLVLDSLDWLEPLVWSRTAMLGNKEHIEDFGFGKGYIQADAVWAEILTGLSALNKRGMTIILLAHAEIKRFDAPDTEPYDRYQIKLHKRAADLVQEWADVVAFAHYEVFTQQTDAGFGKTVNRGVGAGRRLLALEERPAYRAKNRYNLPAVISLDWAEFAAACAPAFASAAGPVAPAPEIPEDIINNESSTEQLTGASA